MSTPRAGSLSPVHAAQSKWGFVVVVVVVVFTDLCMSIGSVDKNIWQNHMVLLTSQKNLPELLRLDFISCSDLFIVHPTPA